MPDKKRERFYLETLRKALADFPAGGLVSGETPDFIVHSENRRVGIEITAFHLPPAGAARPHQEQESLKERIVGRAEETHRRSGGAGLYVNVFFRDEPPLKKIQVETLGTAIAEAVLRTPAPGSIDDGAVEVSWELLPDDVVSIGMHASVDGEDRLWQPAGGGWVAPISPSHVQFVVSQKARTCSSARQRCDELWLVVVDDQFSHAAPAQLSEEARQWAYTHPFDRLLWLLPHAPTVISLLTAEPVV